MGERVMEERAMGRPGIRRRPDASGEGKRNSPLNSLLMVKSLLNHIDHPDYNTSFSINSCYTRARPWKRAR